MDQKLSGILWMCALFTSILIGAYFFSQTGIGIDKILTINAFPLINALLSINFAVFLIFASLSLGLILVIAKKFSFKYASIFSIMGYLIGIIISVILFKELANVFIFMAFGIIAIPLGIIQLSKKEEELKYFKKIRAASFGAGRIILVLSLGCFITLLFIGITTQEKLKQDFVPEFLKMSIGDGVTLSDTFQMQLADSMIKSQSILLDQILGFDEFNSFQTNNDIDGLTLKAKLEQIKANLKSEETKKAALEKMNEQKIDLGGELISKLNFIDQLSNYAWIIYAIAGFTLFTLIGGVIVKNLSAGFYSAIFIIFPKVYTLEGETEENDKE